MSSTLGLSAAQVERALEAAAQAPSLYDTQPWRFRIRRELIELHAEPARSLPAADPDGRELRLSCGAALFNLRLALQSVGVRPLVTLLPDGLAYRRSPALAVIRHGGHAVDSPELVRLLDAVPGVRRTREPFQDVPVSPEQRIVLSRAVEAERSWPHVVTEAHDRATLSNLVSRARRAQQADATFQAERAAWVPYGGTDDVPSGGNYAGTDPFVLMVCSFHSGPSAELQSGQALQRLLLTATTLGLAGSSLSQPLAVPDLRAELRRKLGTPLHPHAILRLGLGVPAPHPPSRPLTDLVLAESARS